MASEAMTILGIKGLTGGLTNQRFALLGLLSVGIDRGAHVRFPNQMADFVPRPGAGEPPRLLFWELYDIAVFRETVSGYPVTSEMHTELIPFSDLMSQGASLCFRASAEDYSAKFLLGLRASPPLQATANLIREWLRERNAFALQLRIERDWHDYITTKTPFEGEENTVDPHKIFQKIRETAALDRYTSVYACCDEGDLVMSKDDLKRIAQRFHLDVLFKTDLPASIELPNVLLKRSMVDYTVCKGMVDYVGLSRSTFSRSLEKEALWTEKQGACYIYNVAERGLRLRYGEAI